MMFDFDGQRTYYTVIGPAYTGHPSEDDVFGR